MQRLQIQFLDTNQSELGYHVTKKWYQKDFNGVWQPHERDIATISRTGGNLNVFGLALNPEIISSPNPVNDQTEIYQFLYTETETRYFAYSVTAFNSNGQSIPSSSPFLGINNPLILPVPLGGTTTLDPNATSTSPIPTSSTTSTSPIPTTLPPTTTPRNALPAHVYITYPAFLESGNRMNYYPTLESQGWDFGGGVDYYQTGSDQQWEDELKRRGMRYRLNGNSTYDPWLNMTFYHFSTYESGDPVWEIKWRANIDMGQGAFDPKGAWVIGFGGDVYTTMNYTGGIFPNSADNDTNNLDYAMIQQPWSFGIVNPSPFHFQEGEESLTQGFSDLGITFP